MDRINVACVGTGYWGKNLVRNFYSLPECSLKVCCDLNQETLKKIAVQYPGVQVAQDYNQVLEDPGIDAVILASPADKHYIMAKQALEAKKHTYVEKPLTLHPEEAEDLCHIARLKNKVLMVGHLMEYHPGVTKLKQLVDEGTLGEIYYLYMQRLNLGIIRRDENVLWSLAPHDVSMVLYILGVQPETVSAKGESYVQAGVEDVVFCNLHFPNRTIAHIHVSWLDPQKVRKLTIVGSKRMAVFNDSEPTEKIRIYDKGINGADYKSYGDALTLRFGDITIPRVDMAEPLRTECAHFLECIRKEKTPRSDGQDGLRVVGILNAAEKSLRNNGADIHLH